MPTGKLDAWPTPVLAVGEAGAVVANRPEGVDRHGVYVRWREAEVNVARLRQRIFKATQAGDLKQVRNLQKLMLASLSNTLLSVRRVTQINAGRHTAGVDGEVALTPQDRVDVANRAHPGLRSWQALPVRRVHIPKANGKLRPLGIPVILDRVQQMRVKNALEPEWEARFEPKSYGFRPGRGCHDAIEAIYWTLNGKGIKRQWILDADLSAAFDRIGHDHLLDQLGGFPARDLVRRWLKAGVIERDCFTPTDEGTPQGGVISPTLLNVALHGLEEAAGVRYAKLGSNIARTVTGCPVLVRYADDLVAICHTQQQAEQVKEHLAAWLARRGLTFNENKTRIVHLSQGYDFLGFNIRRYPNGTLLIKPSKQATRRIRGRLSAEMRAMNGGNAIGAIRKINPIVRGWSTYYRGVVSKDVFDKVDDHLWWITYQWARRQHPNKSRAWVRRRYFGMFNQSRRDRWVFGDRDSGAFLVKFVWTKIVRHQMGAGTASPDDPALAEYWANRHRRRPTWPVDKLTLKLLNTQRGQCPVCGNLLLLADDQPQSPQQWELWLRTTRKAIKKHSLALRRSTSEQDDDSIRLVHVQCRPRTRTKGPRRNKCGDYGVSLGRSV